MHAPTSRNPGSDTSGVPRRTRARPSGRPGARRAPPRSARRSLPSNIERIRASMPSVASSLPVRRVSSATTRSTVARVSRARVLRSPRLPIGVATTCSTPPMRRWSHVRPAPAIVSTHAARRPRGLLGHAAVEEARHPRGRTRPGARRAERARDRADRDRAAARRRLVPVANRTRPRRDPRLRHARERAATGGSSRSPGRSRPRDGSGSRGRSAPPAPTPTSTSTWSTGRGSTRVWWTTSRRRSPRCSRGCSSSGGRPTDDPPEPRAAPAAAPSSRTPRVR